MVIMGITETSNASVLDLIANGITIIGDGQSAGPFNNAEEMKKAFEEMNVDGADTVGEKP